MTSAPLISSPQASPGTFRFLNKSRCCPVFIHFPLSVFPKTYQTLPVLFTSISTRFEVCRKLSRYNNWRDRCRSADIVPGNSTSSSCSFLRCAFHVNTSTAEVPYTAAITMKILQSARAQFLQIAAMEL
ncbi:hypothetical protein PUN28_007947 [Cardiocondyla obscurior]|uniref:Uncharacterized protein n=1 Tax=Cardiocondyla obscurior TaxID=286306 RepID=A0AAW2FWP7_9HYME